MRVIKLIEGYGLSASDLQSCGMYLREHVLTPFETSPNVTSPSVEQPWMACRSVRIDRALQAAGLVNVRLLDLDVRYWGKKKTATCAAVLPIE